MTEEDLCTAEYPGDDLHMGQLCERQADHSGQHCAAVHLLGSVYTRTLTWSDR